MKASFSFLLVVLCLSSFFISTLTGTFEVIDKDHDGSISKNEFDGYLTSFQRAVGPFMAIEDGEQGNLVGGSGGSIQLGEGVKKDDPLNIEDDLLFWQAAIKTFMMIMVTEMGDKTFFLAALLAMQYSKGVVFGGAMCKIEF